MTQMDDYISRQKLMDAVKLIIDRDTSGENAVVNAMTAWNEYIKGLPSEDVQPVVRCKDCKYFDSGTDEDGKPFFKCLCWVYGRTSEDDFCSFGEIKDGEQNETD